MTEWVPRNKYKAYPGVFIGSREEDLDRRISALIGNLVSGTIVDDERVELQHLQADRTRSLMSVLPSDALRSPHFRRRFRWAQG
jgi:hypothetical protein